MPRVPTVKATISLPRPIIRAVDKIGAREYRSRSKVIRDVSRQYLQRRKSAGGTGIPEVEPGDEGSTAAALAKLDRRIAAVEKGEFVSLQDVERQLGRKAR